jgi:hypothetical protein
MSIAHVPIGRTWALRPVNDSLPLRTWRNERRVGPYCYPEAGCHGAPLERECPCDGTGTVHDYGGPFDCGYCGGSGRIRCDAPNRTDGP